MKAKIIALIVTGVCGYSLLSAQNLVSGTVYDRLNNNPLIGANVRVEGSAIGSVTDKSGQFELELPESPSRLIISYVGYETLELSAKTGDKLEVAMKRDLIAFSDDVVIVGSRTFTRTVTSSAVPVDQFPDAVLENTGRTDLSQQINSLAPSFYSTRLTYSDATDHMDPAALRGMNPDQTLILVNGKRLHPSAVVNVLSVVGKGSVINDLNTIPSSAVKRVEILRDGASAQYGSDAIAGVINVVLKEDTGGVVLTTHAGQFYEGDGFERNFSANFGTSIAEKGFINLTTEIGVRDNTNRAGVYQGLIYRTEDQDDLSFEENLSLDNQELMDRGLSREDFRLQLGNSALTNASLYFNASIPFSDRTGFYAFGGMNYRNSISAGDYRFPNDPARVILNLYPNGFLPEISARLSDNYITTGINTWITDWEVALSTICGTNDIDLFVAHHVYASMGGGTAL
jgi:iron complex outermembrane receptor protein